MSGRKCKGDYTSPDGFSTFIWGPAMWHILHTISFNYPNDPTPGDKDTYYRFILSLGSVLPCRVCRDNFRNNLRAVGFVSDHVEQGRAHPMMANRHAFSLFVYNLHKEVSNTQGRDWTDVVSFYHMRANYEMFRAKCIPNSKSRLGTVKHGGCVKQTTHAPARCVITIEPFLGV